MKNGNETWYKVKNGNHVNWNQVAPNYSSHYFFFLFCLSIFQLIRGDRAIVGLYSDPVTVLISHRCSSCSLSGWASLSLSLQLNMTKIRLTESLNHWFISVADPLRLHSIRYNWKIVFLQQNSAVFPLLTGTFDLLSLCNKSTSVLNIERTFLPYTKE